MNDRIIASVLFLAGFILASFLTLDVDIGFHIKTGEYIVQHGVIPSSNTFSFVEPDHPWPLHQWLPDILLYLLWLIGGMPLIIVGKAFVVGLIAYLWYRILREVGECEQSLALLMVVVLLCALRFRFFERPDLLSAFLFFSTFLLTLAPKRDDVRSMILNLSIPVLWMNVHAGVVYGMLFHGPIWLERMVCSFRIKSEESKREWKQVRFLPFAYLAGALISVAIHPPAIKGLLIPFEYFDAAKDYQISEYQYLTFSRRPFVFSLMIVLWLIFLVRIRSLRSIFPVLLCLGFTWLGFGAERAMLFSLPLVAIFALQKINIRVPTVKAALAAGCTLIAFIILFQRSLFVPGFDCHRFYYPKPLFSLIKSHPWKGKLLNEMGFGGPLLLSGQKQIFVDGRLETYSRDFWFGVYQPILNAAPGWEGRMEKYAIRTVLLKNPLYYQNSVKLAEALHASPDWRLIGWTESALLFARKDALDSDLVDRMAFKSVWPVRIPNEKEIVSLEMFNAEAKRMLQMDPESELALGFYLVSAAKQRETGSKHER
jgi:hypothetical protein